MTPASFYALLGSPFGRSVAYGPRFHAGQDYPWGSGTAIPSFAKGTVVAKGKTRAAGYYVVLLIGGRYFHFYHMREASPLSVGDNVSYGDTVGRVGATGTVTGPHLHLAASTSLTPGYGTRVDPVPLVARYLQASLASGSETSPILETESESNVRSIKNEATGEHVRLGEFSAFVVNAAFANNEAAIWNADGTHEVLNDTDFKRAIYLAEENGKRLVSAIASKVGTPAASAAPVIDYTKLAGLIKIPTTKEIAGAFVAEMKLPGN